MNNILRKWLSVSFFNLMIVAAAGVLLRYKIAFYLPFVEQKNVLHSHSHFAFAGWITQTLLVLLIHFLSLKNGQQVFKKYRWLLYANLITAYGMLLTFILQGYAFFSISFSTLSIFVSYLFAFQYWKDLNRLNEKRISHTWFKAALVFSVISSIGAFYLAYLTANKIIDQNRYFSSIYFFLHFQYNGWFFFAGMGLLNSKLELISGAAKRLRTVFRLFCFACIPAYLLSVLWLPLSPIVYYIIILAVLAQLAGWILMLRIFIKNKPFIKQHFSVSGQFLLLLAAIALTIKLLLQAGSVHPDLSHLAYGFRPIIIGYLHLVLLAVTSVFIIGYIISFELVTVTKKLIAGIVVFVAGIIINELLLMVQGITALTYNSIPFINVLLFIAACILFSGSGIMFTSFRSRKLL